MQKLISELSTIASKYIDETTFPEITQDKVRIGQFSVRKTQTGYVVENIFTGENVASMYTMLGALAIVKQASNQRYNFAKIKKADEELSRLYTDVVFMRNAAENAPDQTMRDIRITRLQQLEHKISKPRGFLRSFAR